MIKTLNRYTAEGQPIQQGQHRRKRGAWEPCPAGRDPPPLMATGTRVWRQRRGLGGLREGPSPTTAVEGQPLPCAGHGPHMGTAPPATRGHGFMQNTALKAGGLHGGCCLRFQFREPALCARLGWGTPQLCGPRPSAGAASAGLPGTPGTSLQQGAWACSWDSSSLWRGRKTPQGLDSGQG